MVTLIFDTDEGRSTVSQFDSTKTNLEKELEILHSKVNNLVGTGWVGNTASEFQKEYEIWQSQLKETLDGLEKFKEKLGMEIDDWESTALMLIESPPASINDRHLLREWWHNILREHGRYSIYALFLLLPSDKEAIRYLKEFYREFDLITGENCLVIILSEKDFEIIDGHPNKNWDIAIDDQVNKGYSLRIAELLDIPLEKFPSLIMFQDIRSSEFISLSLKHISAEDIADEFRGIFSLVNKSVREGHNPLKTIERERKNEDLANKGKSIVSSLQNATGKTLEAVMEAWIKTVIN